MATLEELEAADLLIHVADASHPEVDEQIEAVEAILQDLGIADVPRILALNKWDRVDHRSADQLTASFPGSVRFPQRPGKTSMRWCAGSRRPCRCTPEPLSP
jgi:GTPase